MGKAGPCSPAICRCVTQIQMALDYLGPQFGLVTLQACGGSVTVHFMVMNGTAWRRSHSYSHVPPDDINPSPHYTPLFHACLIQKGQREARASKNRQILEGMVE